MTHPILSVKFQGPSERRSLNNSGLSVNVLDRLPSHATRDPEREAPAPFLAPVLTGNLPRESTPIPRVDVRNLIVSTRTPVCVTVRMLQT